MNIKPGVTSSPRNQKPLTEMCNPEQTNLIINIHVLFNCVYIFALWTSKAKQQISQQQKNKTKYKKQTKQNTKNKHNTETNLNAK